MPADLSRVFGALGYLPPVQDIAQTPLAPAGDWCFNVPLWGNPLLPNGDGVGDGDGDGTETGTGDADAAVTAAGIAAADAAVLAADPDFSPPVGPQTSAAAALPRPGLDRRHTRLATCTTLRTVGDAVRIGRAAENAPAGGTEWEQWVVTQLAPTTAASNFRRGPTRTAINGLLADISTEWRGAAAAVLDRAGGDGQAAAAALAAAGVETTESLRAMIVGRMGWRFSPTLTAKLSDLTVQLATQLQMQPAAEQRARLHAAYEREAREQLLAGPPPAVGQPADAATPSMPATLARLWPLRWEREHKEALWRLAVDGVALRGNAHIRGVSPERCGCGGYGGAGPHPCSPRAHHFWECPVAKAVLAQITFHVSAPITRANVWMVEAPEGVQQCVWDVVALAALAAMERARVGLRAAAGPRAAGVGAEGATTAAAATGEEAPPAAGQLQANTAAASPPPHPQLPPADGNGATAPPAPVEVAKARAVVDFWQRVRGFAELGVPRQGWGGVGADHPILAVVEGTMRCAQPVNLELDEE
jgi:hypothetical protein